MAQAGPRRWQAGAVGPQPWASSPAGLLLPWLSPPPGIVTPEEAQEIGEQGLRNICLAWNLSWGGSWKRASRELRLFWLRVLCPQSPLPA